MGVKFSLVERDWTKFVALKFDEKIFSKVPRSWIDFEGDLCREGSLIGERGGDFSGGAKRMLSVGGWRELLGCLWWTQ